MAASIKAPIQLITNNFKIKSSNKNHGIVYTYHVDFLERGAGAATDSKGAATLETF